MEKKLTQTSSTSQFFVLARFQTHDKVGTEKDQLATMISTMYQTMHREIPC